MTALITGASSGIGSDIARRLDRMGIATVLSGRSTERLEKLRSELKNVAAVIPADLSNPNECVRLYKEASKYDVDILINNAGYGVYGGFLKTSFKAEMEMLNVNIKAVHILTKLFLRDFVKRDGGYILNVSSSAAFMAGPLFSSYYASKNYVQRMSEAISEELRRIGSHVYIGTLCPGPVDTEFNKTAGISASNGIRSMTSEAVADCAVRGMFARKFLILPDNSMQILLFLRRFAPDWLLLKLVYHLQNGKHH